MREGMALSCADANVGLKGELVSSLSETSLAIPFKVSSPSWLW